MLKFALFVSFALLSSAAVVSFCGVARLLSSLRLFADSSGGSKRFDDHRK